MLLKHVIENTTWVDFYVFSVVSHNQQYYPSTPVHSLSAYRCIWSVVPTPLILGSSRSTWTPASRCWCWKETTLRVSTALSSRSPTGTPYASPPRGSGPSNSSPPWGTTQSVCVCVCVCVYQSVCVCVYRSVCVWTACPPRTNASALHFGCLLFRNVCWVAPFSMLRGMILCL